jgi:hypothetical protein
MGEIWYLVKQEVGIWWVRKRFPRYGVPIWSLWLNIRFLPSIVAEKNATKNEHICSFSATIDGRNLIFGHKLHIGTPYRGKRFWTHRIPTSCLGPKTLPTIWGTFMKLVTKYQISAINSCWEKCDEKWALYVHVYKNQQSRQTGSRNPMGEPIEFLLPVCWLCWFLYTLNIYAHFSSHFSQHLLMAEIWYLVTSFI